ncbi:MAG TPA: hypothetical protein VFD00_10745 [Thermoclostridium sp.]|nr:hypothetical protein [Thermoclostridium sp.]
MGGLHTSGFVPNVRFPCATIHDADSGKTTICHGAADHYVALAFTQLDAFVYYIKEYRSVTESDTETNRR